MFGRRRGKKYQSEVNLIPWLKFYALIVEKKLNLKTMLLVNLHVHIVKENLSGMFHQPTKQRASKRTARLFQVVQH